MSNNELFDYTKVKEASMVMRAINHKLRKDILKLLLEHKKLNVTEIYVKMRLEQSVASQHLAIMRRAGILKTDKDGRTVYYLLNIDKIALIAKLTDELMADAAA